MQLQKLGMSMTEISDIIGVSKVHCTEDWKTQTWWDLQTYVTNNKIARSVKLIQRRMYRVLKDLIIFGMWMVTINL